MHVNFPKFQGKHYTLILMITYDDELMFGIPPTAKLGHGSIKSVVCHSSCPELSECVSYALHESQKSKVK